MHIRPAISTPKLMAAKSECRPPAKGCGRCRKLAECLAQVAAGGWAKCEIPDEFDVAALAMAEAAA